MLKGSGSTFEFGMKHENAFSRKAVIAVILGVALVAFEIFNFDTTQYALSNLLGDIRFAGVMWATILAIAFCAIDFAGLVRIFTPERGAEEPRAVWFLTGAWFLGTIANSIMTWWAISLTLLSHEFGNEVLSREALLRYVPIFVAMLVWLTRILFIGAFSVAGEDVLDLKRNKTKTVPDVSSRRDAPAALPVSAAQTRQPATSAQHVNTQTAKPATTTARSNQQPRPAATPSSPPITYEPIDDPFDNLPATPKTNGTTATRPTSRIQQRPPMPGGIGRTPTTGNIQARSTKNNNH